MIKKALVVLAGVLLAASPVMAHCGKCGMDGAAKGGDAAAQCPYHAEKSSTLSQAATELKASNPELASKLEAIAKDCAAKASS